jgi:transposase
MPKRDPFAHTGRIPNEARREAVRAMYHAGMSIRTIALRVGTTYQAVHSLLQRMGVTLRPRGGNTGSHSRRK